MPRQKPTTEGTTTTEQEQNKTTETTTKETDFDAAETTNAVTTSVDIPEPEWAKNLREMMTKANDRKTETTETKPKPKAEKVEKTTDEHLPDVVVKPRRPHWTEKLPRFF